TTYVDCKIVRAWPGSRTAGAVDGVSSCSELGRPPSLLSAQSEPHQRAPRVSLRVRWVAQAAPGEVGPDQRGLREILGMAGITGHEQSGLDERTVTSGDELGELVVPGHGALPSDC